MIGGTNMVAGGSAGKEYVENGAPNFAWLESSKIYEGFVGYWLNIVQPNVLKTVSATYNNSAATLFEIAGPGEILAFKFAIQGSAGGAPAIFEFKISIDGVERHFVYNIGSQTVYSIMIKRVGVLVAYDTDIKAINETGGLTSVAGTVASSETLDDIFAGTTYQNVNISVFTTDASWKFNASFKFESLGKTGGNSFINASSGCVVKAAYKLG